MSAASQASPGYMGGGVVVTAAEWVKQQPSLQERRRQVLRSLKHWRYDSKRVVLVHQGRGAYEVDPETITDSAEALDWLAQIAHKTWSTAECIGELVIALDA